MDYMKLDSKKWDFQVQIILIQIILFVQLVLCDQRLMWSYFQI